MVAVASARVVTSAAHAGQWANTIRPIVTAAAVIVPAILTVLRPVFIVSSVPYPGESCELNALRRIDLLQKQASDGRRATLICASWRRAGPARQCSTRIR